MRRLLPVSVILAILIVGACILAIESHNQAVTYLPTIIQRSTVQHALGDGSTFICKLTAPGGTYALVCVSADGNTTINCTAAPLPGGTTEYFC